MGVTTNTQIVIEMISITPTTCIPTELGALSDRDIVQIVHAAFPTCERKRRRAGDPM